MLYILLNIRIHLIILINLSYYYIISILISI